MRTLLVLAALGLGVSVPNASAIAQPQGSNQAADYALSWGAVEGRPYQAGNAYDEYKYWRYLDRRHSR